MESSARVCPRCSAPVSDPAARFCAACGSQLDPGTCGQCAAPVAAGARFCPKCGAPTGIQPRTRTITELVPWGVAGVALLALFALLAGRGFGTKRGSTLDAPLNALPQAGLDFDRPGAPVRGPDISQLTPEEQADRLFNRVMSLASEGKRDSVMFFAPMAISAYERLAPLNLDQHYDVGRIAEVAGALPLARARADSILRRSPTHLLGLLLAMRVAALQGDSARYRTLEARFVSAEPGERARPLPEYARHREEIDATLAAARRRTR